jgi:hypothetical protein
LSVERGVLSVEESMQALKSGKAQDTSTKRKRVGRCG